MLVPAVQVIRQAAGRHLEEGEPAQRGDFLRHIHRHIHNIVLVLVIGAARQQEGVIRHDLGTLKDAVDALRALAAFLSTYALQSGISAFVAAFPQWLVHGFEVAGGLMPAVGLALLLVVMLKKENAAYLLAGFVIMVITNCQNILPIAVIAGCIAYVNFTRDMETAKLTAASAATAAQEGDFEDGI